VMPGQFFWAAQGNIGYLSSFQDRRFGEQLA
jgi:hypothetical protein